MITQDVKEKSLEIIGLGLAEIVNNYSKNALLINACFVAADRYRTFEGEMQLSTTLNIPEPLRLDNEIEVVFSKADLLQQYSDDVLQVIFKNYIVVSVSLVDETLESLYEFLLRSAEPAITDTELEKKVRNAWTNDSMLNYLSDGNGPAMAKPAQMQTEFREAFMRYSELRILRHTLLHTGEALSDKNHAKLTENEAATPQARTQLALLNSPLFNADRKVLLNLNSILSVRQYLDRFLMYLFRSVGELPV